MQIRTPTHLSGWPAPKRCHGWYEHIHWLGMPACMLIPYVAELARAFKTDGMLAYVNLIQKKEKEIGCDVLTHQKWYAIIY